MTEPNDARDETPADRADADLENGPMVVFEITVPAESFALPAALAESPDVLVEFERLVPANRSPLRHLWIAGEDTPGFREAARADAAVERFVRRSSFDNGALYAVDWKDATDGLLGRLIGHRDGFTLLQAQGRTDEWRLKLRFPSREHLSRFRQFTSEMDLDVHVDRLYDLEDPKLGQYDLTEKQREALLRALELGYFEVPRSATLQDVADVLGISPKSVSERLRRGQTNLVTNSLAIGYPDAVGVDDR
jgi:predicted DNA binding protein